MSLQARLGRVVWLNRAHTFGLISRILHWMTALLIAVNIPLGFYVASLPRDDQFREILLSQMHKPLGLLLLFVVAIRLGWHVVSPRPQHVQSLKSWEVRLASVVHVSLYGLMLAVPLSGILLSQSAGHDVSFFGLYDLPVLLPIDASVPVPQRLSVMIGAVLHTGILDFALLAALSIHLGGVIKHYLIDGRRLDIRRMWGVSTD
jgi:cytochrome b561